MPSKVIYVSIPVSVDLIEHIKPQNLNDNPHINSFVVLKYGFPGLSVKEKELKTIEKAIKEVMINSNLDCCEGYTLKRNSKQVFDEERFAKEHPKSYEGYLIDKVEVKLSKNIKEDD